MIFLRGAATRRPLRERSRDKEEMLGGTRRFPFTSRRTAFQEERARDDIIGLVGWRGDISIDRAMVFWLAGNVGMTKWVNW